MVSISVHATTAGHKSRIGVRKNIPYDKILLMTIPISSL